MSKSSFSVVIALGYFDSVHLGHQKVIEKAREIADEYSSNLVVFSFKGNIKEALTGIKENNVYSNAEREKLFYNLGADDVYFAPANSSFLEKGKLAFLNFLCEKYNVKAFVCGEDYTFGKNAEGDISYLKEYAKRNGKKVFVVDLLLDEDVKISTTKIKELLKEGNVERANKLLGRSYSITGKVLHGRGVGAKIGTPTINLDFGEKQPVLEGVYAGRCEIGNKKYKAAIFFGSRPTFNIKEKQIEVHILDFSGDIYGKIVTVYFDKFIRENIKFDNESQLSTQINCDIEKIKGIK